MTEFKGTTHVCLIWDESGSMAWQTKEGKDAYREQRDALLNAGGDVKFTYVLFGTQYRTGANVVLDGVDIKDTPAQANYRPNGGTPLYDAIGISLDRLGKIKKKDRALVVIFTDGFENASREWNEDSIGKAIKKRTDKGNWTFTYSAAGLDQWQARAAAQSINISAGSTFTSPSVMRTTAGNVNSTVSYMAAGASATQDFYAGTPDVVDPEKDKKDKHTSESKS